MKKVNQEITAEAVERTRLALVVDDDSVSRAVLTDHLAALGFMVKKAEDAETGLGLYKLHQPQVVVCDKILPEMSGIDFCGKIRALQHGDRCLFILVSSSRRTDDLQQAFTAGVDDFLLKPVTAEMLDDRLTVLEVRRRTLLSQSGNRFDDDTVTSDFTYDEEDGGLAEENLAAEIERALERGEFEPYYQPIVSLETGRLAGFEALARWNHPTRGLLSPFAFVPYCEKTGNIDKLTYNLLRIVAANARDWNNEFSMSPQLYVSFNVSGKLLETSHSLDTILGIIEHHQCEPGIIRLEITESEMAEQSREVIEAMDRLRDRGIKFCLDDFGMGYSSLGYLQNFPVDVLKIDRAFVENMMRGGDGHEIVHAIVSLAQSVKLDVIAEGVDTIEQLTALRSLGCEFAQGFFLSRPESLENTRERIAAEYRYHSSVVELAVNSAIAKQEGARQRPLDASRTVLVLDDDTVFLDFLVYTLESHGIRVLGTANPVKALDILSHENIDVLVVDYLLPNSTGTRFVETARSTGYTGKAVLLSAFWRDHEGTKLEIKEADIVQVFEKKDSLRELPAWLEQNFAIEKMRDDDGPVEHSRAENPGVAERRRENLAAEYKEKFLSTLQARVLDLAILVEKIKQGGGDAATLRSAHTIAHNIYGSAAAVGLIDLSASVKVIENKLYRHMKDGGGVGPEFVAKLASALTRLEQSLNESAGQSGTVGSNTGRDEVFIPRVLAIIDNESELKSLLEINNSGAIDLVTCSADKESFRAVKGGWFDVAVIDLDAEVADQAYEIAREIKANDATANLPLAFLCADPSLEVQLGAVRAGGSAFLYKPLDTDDILDTVYRLSTIRRAGQPKVLVLDADREAATRLADVLRAGYMHAVVSDESADTLQLIEEVNPDLLIMETVMPFISGLEVCKLVRAHPRWQELPIIFVSKQTEINLRVAAFQAGADDFIEKPFDSEDVIARIHVRLERSRLFHGKGSKDHLTGLLNRRVFNDVAEMFLAEAQRSNMALSVAVIDLDHFKQINDTYGHLNGDAVLANFGKLLINSIRKEDTKARWGGEEFIVAFYGQDCEKAVYTLNRIKNEFKAIDFFTEANEKFNVSFSAGVAAFPGDAMTLEDLIQLADKRLYAAKQGGRDQVVAK